MHCIIGLAIALLGHEHVNMDNWEARKLGDLDSWGHKSHRILSLCTRLLLASFTESIDPKSLCWLYQKKKIKKGEIRKAKSEIKLSYN